LHIEYDVLYVADLRRIVRTFDSAYNILQRAEEPTGRMRRSDRLTVQAARTGNSITLTLLGGMGIAALGRLFATREGFWKSEKIKWEAKSARLDYEEKARLLDEAKMAQAEAELKRIARTVLVESGSDRKARTAKVETRLHRERDPAAESAKLMEKLNKFVDKSKEIRSIDVEIDGQDSDPRSPAPLIGPVAPRKQLGPLTIPKGRKFRS
jgi:Skp family chaperone for outer membrane proteins